MTERVLDLWERTLRAVAEDKLALIESEIDWAIKLRLLDRYATKHRLSFADPRVAQLDLAYHDIRRSARAFLPAGVAGPQLGDQRPSDLPGEIRATANDAPSCAAISSAPLKRAATITRWTGCISN